VTSGHNSADGSESCGESSGAETNRSGAEWNEGETMAMTYPLIEGAYLRDLLEQPDALRRTLALPLADELLEIGASLRGPRPPFVVLTGMGSSFHALHPLAIRLAQAGIRAVMLETSELIYYWNNLIGTDTILIAVSQSGRSAEMLRLLELNSGRSTLIGITNDIGSPLAQAATLSHVSVPARNLPCRAKLMSAACWR
jgi:fructoselysine-6-P-deglycase FrlB-like protein